MGQQDLHMMGLQTPKQREKIRLCMHKDTRHVGMGYALCDDCGALLPDEDPDLHAKCQQPER